MGLVLVRCDVVVVYVRASVERRASGSLKGIKAGLGYVRINCYVRLPRHEDTAVHLM